LPPRPNPFRETASIEFTIPSGPGLGRIAIYDARGRLVRVLVDGAPGRGRHVVTWDGTGDAGERVAAGVYFCSLEVPGAVLARKLTLLR
jgi:flagellar hook assembly protein FlgD